MNWGFKITILYTGFVLLILSMVGLTMREKVDLVAQDYYEQELKYQNKIDKLNRTSSLAYPLTWEVKPGELILKFPTQIKGEAVNGNIYFFRPSDANLDKTIPIPTDTSGIKRISTRELKKGLYKMQVSWEANKEEYYTEGIIQIN